MTDLQVKAMAAYETERANRAKEELERQKRAIESRDADTRRLNYELDKLKNSQYVWTNFLNQPFNLFDRAVSNYNTGSQTLKNQFGVLKDAFNMAGVTGGK